jgi:2-succinyl-5-enolpyruvyl-6-hydroxy-3-cyclohexene-1-carboxylate synthase
LTTFVRSPALTSPAASEKPTAPNASTALARVLVDELARCGLTDAVLAPGSRSTALALAFDDDVRVRLHVSLDERSASFVALGLARATGRAAAVVTTSGSAVANLHPAIIEAHHGAVPLVVLTADRPAELRETAANQSIDQVKIFGDAVRWFVDLGTPSDVPGANAFWRSTVSQAWARAHSLSGPAGPVHLNVPFREPTVPHTDDGRTSSPAFFGEIAGRAGGAPFTKVRRAAQESSGAAEAIADAMRNASRGLVLLGAGDFVPAPVTQLARAAHVPLIAEPFSNGRRGASGIAHGHLLVAAGLAPQPDVVVRVGRTGVSRAVEQWLAGNVRQILVDAHGRFLDPGRAVAEIVVADPDACLGLAARLLREQPPADNGLLQAWRDRDAEVAAILDETFAQGPLTGPAVARTIVAALPVDAAFVVASSAPIRDVDAYAPLREDVFMLGNRGASGIDGFTSTALGAALGWPGPTVALAGDLSFLHDQNGWLLREDGPAVDLVMVVVDNNGGGLFHGLPVASEPSFERLFGTPHGLELGAVGRALGLQVASATTTDSLTQAVTDAIASGGRHVIHVRTDRAHESELRTQLLERVRRLERLSA